MAAIYIIIAVIALLFVVRGIIDICRELDRADMTERDE
jgi:hypothetical protein